jgi:hypothetical protein
VHTDRAAPANQPLDAIDCVSRTMCVAVGTAYSGGHTYAAAERWNGTSWHLMSVPQPAKHLSRASGISCPSTTSCALVGQYRVSARGAYRAFAAIWRHGKWTRSHVAVPATKAPPDSGLSDVSCVSGRRCVAVGGYSTDDADEGRSLFEQWDGSRWTPMHTSSELATASPTSISCTARHHCVAMSPPSGTGGQQSFVLSGSSWHIEPFAGPATNWLRGLDCVSARACFAVGLREGANRDRTLAEYRGPAWRVVTTP